jgi:hypothetical protein
MGNGSETMSKGFRILSVLPESPMSVLKIEPMLDFIIFPGEVNQIMSFDAFIAQNENKEVEFNFYNVASQTIWKGKITPRKWKGKGLLGVNIREEDYTTAHSRAIRVLNFFMNSPLHKAGFKPFSDYILGTQFLAFEDLEEMQNYVRAHDNQPIEIVVYNSDDGKCRNVILTPNKKWGGTGSLGGDIGYGHLHSLPKREKEVKPVPLPVVVQEIKKQPEAEVKPTKEELKAEEIKKEDAQKPEVKKEPEKKVTEVLGVSENDILIGKETVTKKVEGQSTRIVEKAKIEPMREANNVQNSPKTDVVGLSNTSNKGARIESDIMI